MLSLLALLDQSHLIRSTGSGAHREEARKAHAVLTKRVHDGSNAIERESMRAAHGKAQTNIAQGPGCKRVSFIKTLSLLL